MNWNDLLRRLATAAAAIAVVGLVSSAALAVSLSDGFGDADRNNDGAITLYDNDVNLSGTINMGGVGEPDEDLNAKGLIEVTAAEDANDVGIIWHAARGFTSSNTDDPKPNLKIINDNVATGAELSQHLHNSGLALSWEAKGSGSSAVGFFGQTIELGDRVGDKVVVEFDFRFWRESNNATAAPNPGELRWGLFQDTDNQFGMTNNEGRDDGNGQALVVWGPDTGENDGDWRDADPGPVGDRGIWTRVPLGPSADPESARIVYEHNLDGIDGSNNQRFLEGGGVGGTGSNRDVGTIASASGGQDGPGGIVGSLDPHTLRMEVIRVLRTNVSTGIEVATFIDGVETMRDDLKTTDTAFPFLGVPPQTFDYIAMRNTGSNGDFDFVIDNFSIANVNIPEPASWLLCLAGGALLAVRRKR